MLNWRNGSGAHHPWPHERVAEKGVSTTGYTTTMQKSFIVSYIYIADNLYLNIIENYKLIELTVNSVNCTEQFMWG